MYDLEIGLRVYPGISKKPSLKGSKLETFEKVYGSILETGALIVQFWQPL